MPWGRWRWCWACSRPELQRSDLSLPEAQRAAARRARSSGIAQLRPPRRELVRRRRLAREPRSAQRVWTSFRVEQRAAFAPPPEPPTASLRAFRRDEHKLRCSQGLSARARAQLGAAPCGAGPPRPRPSTAEPRFPNGKFKRTTCAPCAFPHLRFHSRGCDPRARLPLAGPSRRPGFPSQVRRRVSLRSPIP